jgi:guanylate kinase
MPDLELAVSATTRGRREGEENGREYWFISAEDFAEKLAAGDFLEYVDFPWGQRSGTLRSEIEPHPDARAGSRSSTSSPRARSR